MTKHVKHTRYNLYEYNWLLRNGWECVEVIDGIAKMVKWQ